MTAETMSTAMRVHPISPKRLRAMRSGNGDDNGEAVVARIDDAGGAPLRCCLRESRIGERIALIGYRPFRKAGPYAEVGPVFVHADECAGYPMTDRCPDEFRLRPQIFRAYRAEGSIAGGVLVKPGRAPEQALAELLSDPEIAFVHSRNVIYGCFMFEITRHE